MLSSSYTSQESSSLSADDRFPVSVSTGSGSSTPRSSDSGYDINRANVTLQYGLRTTPDKPRLSRNQRQWSRESQSSLEEVNVTGRDANERRMLEATISGPTAAAAANFPAGFGGWNASKLYEAQGDDRRTAAMTGQSRTAIALSMTSSSTMASDVNLSTDPEMERRKVSQSQIARYIFRACERLLWHVYRLSASITYVPSRSTSFAAPSATNFDSNRLEEIYSLLP